jgi:hypothetical protein
MQKPSTIVKALMLETGRGSHMFNDRLRDGTRSIKVWNWSADEYNTAKERLTRAGYTVKFVTTKGVTTKGVTTTGPYWSRPQTRMHVKEG